MDTHMQATTIPEGQNWPRVKMVTSKLCSRSLMDYVANVTTL